MKSMFSSSDMYTEWQYGIEQDFTPANGEAIQMKSYTIGSRDEQTHIPFVRNSGSKTFVCSSNADDTLLALAVGSEIDVYNLISGTRHRTLRGHLSEIDCLQFHPIYPLQLVSSAYGKPSRENPAKPNNGEIIFWDLGESSIRDRQPAYNEQGCYKEAAQHALEAMTEFLATRNCALTLEPNERLRAQDFLLTLLNEQQITSLVLPINRLAGRLLGMHFQSTGFSPDGMYMLYLPGGRASSNGNDDWQIFVIDTRTKKTVHALIGNMDAIMWAGFSPDQKVIATCCWDETVRIWSALDGAQIHTFQTDNQNWAGVFSPDSTRFLGTSGDGCNRIWDLQSGNTIWMYTSKTRTWCRQVDWSQDGDWVAIGGGGKGRIALFDMHSTDSDNADNLGRGKTEAEPQQERILSVESMPENTRKYGSHMLEVNSLRFLSPASSNPSSTRIAYTTRFDHGVEVYDITSGKKWRFAPELGKGGEYSSGWVYMKLSGQIVTISEDSLRFWDLL